MYQKTFGYYLVQEKKFLTALKADYFWQKIQIKFQHVPFPTTEPETEPEVPKGPAIEP